MILLHHWTNSIHISDGEREGTQRHEGLHEVRRQRSQTGHDEPGGRFSKDPVTTGPDNLQGRLTGNFTRTGIAFLEAPVNFTGSDKIAACYQSLTHASRWSAREGERLGTTSFIRFHAADGFDGGGLFWFFHVL